MSDEAGLTPLSTALEQEGFGVPGAERVLEGFARHLMRQLDHWQAAGFPAVAKNFLSKLDRERGTRCEIVPQRRYMDSGLNKLPVLFLSHGLARAEMT